MALKDYDDNTYLLLKGRSITFGEWSVAPKNEWAAFGSQLGITINNYSAYSLKDRYWSQADYEYNASVYANFSKGVLYNAISAKYCYVRLSRKF